MTNTGNSVANDNGMDCHSPYHDSRGCSRCEYEHHLDLIRSDFRNDYCQIDDTTYPYAEMKLDALFELEDRYKELGVDMDKIINEGKSYLDY